MSPSKKSPGKGEEAKTHYTCLLTNKAEAEAVLKGAVLAEFTPEKERTLYRISYSGFTPERLKLAELSLGQRIQGRVTSSDRLGVRLDLGLPFTAFVSKADLNGVSATYNSVLEVEVKRIDLAENLVSLKALANLSATEDTFNELLCISTKMSCSLCGVNFNSREEQVIHYKLDWHRYNLKQRILGLHSVSESAFNDMAEAISSLSGSESEDGLNGDESSETGSETGSPKRKLPLTLSHTVLRSRHRSASVTSTDDTEGEADTVSSMARVHNKNTPETSVLLMSMVHSLPACVKWAVILVGGGHFAAAIYYGSEVKCHKTLHRYTVRAKQGGAQCSKDSRGGGGCKSAGATLRRYNEAALIKDIQDCLNSWSTLLSECDTVFFRAPSFNRVALFGNKSPPFNKDDPRLRVIPFATRRATYKEVQRVQTKLATLECHGPESQFDEALLHPISSPIKRGKPKPKPTSVITNSCKEVITESRTECLEGSNRDVLLELEADVDSEPELVLTEEVHLTSDLQEMSISVKRPPRKKKKKPKGAKRQQDPGTPVGQESERYQLKNALYSACSSGELSKVQDLIAKLSSLGVKTMDDNSNTLPLPELLNSSKSLLNANSCVESHPSPTDSELDFSTGVLQFNTSVPLNVRLKEEPLGPSPEEVLKDILNEAVGDLGGTLLHVAAKNGHREIVWILMELGADPTIKNKQGHTPYVLAGEKDTRNEFRKFWGSNPDQYDYSKSQIPGPLTTELERAQQERAAERRKEKKKVQKVKLKEQKEIEVTARKEAEEKKRFLSLSDREKRALAAERRIISSGTTSAFPLSRCFLCGLDITGQVPFEYNDNRFCSPKCVQVHRKRSNSTKT